VDALQPSGFVGVDEFLTQPRRYRLQLEVSRGCDDREFMLRRDDLRLLPGVEADGRASDADTCRLGGPDRAVQLDVSTPLLQLVPLP
jgi:hypothetical protein